MASIMTECACPGTDCDNDSVFFVSEGYGEVVEAECQECGEHFKCAVLCRRVLGGTEEFVHVLSTSRDKADDDIITGYVKKLEDELAACRPPDDPAAALTMQQVVCSLMAGRVLLEVVHDGESIPRLWRFHDGAFDQKPKDSPDAQWTEDFPTLDPGSEWTLFR